MQEESIPLLAEKTGVEKCDEDENMNQEGKHLEEPNETCYGRSRGRLTSEAENEDQDQEEGKLLVFSFLFCNTRLSSNLSS
jgi:hypothetical protein